MTMYEISQWCNVLTVRVLTPGYQTTQRDAAEAAELVNAYIDELERLEKTAKPYSGADIKTIADDIVERWHTNDTNL